MSWHYLYLAWVDARRSPWLVVIVVSTLAVGLMTSMSTLALRHALTGDPIPAKSARLLTLRGPSGDARQYGLFSYAQAVALGRVGQTVAEPVVSGGAVVLTVAVEGKAIQAGGGLGVRYTTASFFDVFDVPLKAGRVWTRQEQLDGTPVIVVSEDAADWLFPDGKAVGKRILMGDVLYTVVGVLRSWNPEPRYYDLDSPAGAFGGGGDAFYLPYTAVRYAPQRAGISMICPGSNGAPSIPQPSQLPSSPCRWMSMWYLAHDPAAVAGFRSELRAQMPRVLPAAQEKELQLLNVRELLARANLVPASLQTYLLLGIAFLGLCVVNASGMQLSRAMRRTSSIGIRRAMGARRIDIVWQHLLESLLIGGVGGIAGIALTYAALGLVREIPQRYVAYSNMAHVDGAMLAVMVAVALACSVLAGLVPALVASRTDPALAIKDVE